MSQLDPVSILGPGGTIARRLPAYENRGEQLEMARAVACAIDKPGHLVVEAGTGVGKSFAYLVPSILAAVQSGKKVVISTHTIALQEQLLNKDIPFLRSVMGEEFTAVLVKGRSNYISLRRLEVAVSRQASLFQRPEDVDQLATIRIWSGRTTDGSRSDLDFRPSAAVWDSVQSEDGNCLGRECKTYAKCFFYSARRRVQNANLLIVNHALFVTDLTLRDSEGSSASCPSTTWPSSTRPIHSRPLPSQHLGLQISNVGVDLRLTRLYNDRNDRGLLAIKKLDDANAPGHARPGRGRHVFRADRRLVPWPAVRIQRPRAWSAGTFRHPTRRAAQTRVGDQSGRSPVR